MTQLNTDTPSPSHFDAAHHLQMHMPPTTDIHTPESQLQQQQTVHTHMHSSHGACGGHFVGVQTSKSIFFFFFSFLFTFRFFFQSYHPHVPPPSPGQKPKQQCHCRVLTMVMAMACTHCVHHSPMSHPRFLHAACSWDATDHPL